MEAYQTIDFTEEHKQLAQRGVATHKRDYGHVCIVGGGQVGYSGAVCLAAGAALRSGAGLVSAIVHPSALVLMNRAPAELMCHTPQTVEETRALMSKATVWVLGPGLGQSSWAQEQFDSVFSMPFIPEIPPRPIVIDADGLNLLAKNPMKQTNWILTPHPGEAARLLGVSVEDIQSDRAQAARKLHEKFGGVIVLKGAGTLVYTLGEPMMQCNAGNPGMASGGMGDVLAGLIGGLLAQGLSLWSAAKLGVVVHALAADAQRDQGERGMLASDLLLGCRALLK